MMERLTAYDRPFYGRADNLVLDPLDIVDTATATGLDGADAIDAHLVTGGLPGILRSWPHAMPALPFLRQECADPAAPVFGVPESALLAEFPAPDQARRVVEAVGGGDRTHANIAATAGSRHGAVPSGSLSPMLRRLVQFDPEVDLVGADRAPVAQNVDFIGSVKWLGSLFDDHDLAELRRGAMSVPGVTPGRTGTVIVSLSGMRGALDGVDLTWGPEEIVAAWR